MPTDFLQRDTTAGVMADLTATETTWNKRDFATTAGTSASIIPTVAVSATETSYSDTPAVGADAVGFSGTLTYTIKITVASGVIANAFLSVRVARYNTSGVLQTLSAASTEQAIATAQVYTFTVSADVGTYASTDRIRVHWIWRNSSTMNIQTPSITVNTATATLLTVPWPIIPDVYYTPQTLQVY